MISALVDAGYAALLAYGLPALFVLFIVKGAIIGKPFPTSVFLPGYIVAVSASRWTIVASVLVASLGYTCGQLLIYWLAAARGREAVESLPRVSITDDQYARAERWFQRYAGAGIVITNLVPYVGSFIMIPAGIASYPFERAAFYALTSTLLNYVLIVWVVVGSVQFVTG
ncbi:DedA family protein [Halopiger aswanensis]|uniref:SNARE associated Golgi protein n=1 Tax=Halopiger aswanensis TaxID=148449 RepID=A0A419WEN1_9EURY|nr:VTT domain-containing protein [Halopiger aswanensis]RKD93842.1 SNARE associated Golgi protein [Halopiger aswanensis]